MKYQKLSLLVAVSLGWGVCSHAYASRRYGMAGCGLGSLVFTQNRGQISAATTNGSFYSQLFGITSGTSNCKGSKEMAVILEQQEFLAANMTSLQKELAQGDGSTVRAFVEVLGCHAAVHQAATQQLIEGYHEIFRAGGIEGVLDVAKERLSKDRETAAGCDKLG